MKHFELSDSRRWGMLAVLFLLLCVARPNASYAQPNTNVPAVEEPVDTPVDIDPVAKQALQDLGARYKTLHSYADTTTVETTGQETLVYECRWEQPDKVRLERKKGEVVTAAAISDGTHFWAFNPEHPGYYLERTADKERFVGNAFYEAGVGGPGAGFLVGDFDIASLEKQGLRVLRFQGEEKVDGVTCRLITAKADGADGGTTVFTCYIGIEDGVLHQVSGEYNGRFRGVKSIEKHTGIRINPDFAPETWKFMPPAGLKPTENYPSDPHRFDPLVKIGDVLSPFQATTLDGKTLNLADYGDEKKVVVLHFFASTEFSSEVKRLKEVLDAHQKEGFAVIGISMDGRRSAVEKFVQDNQVPWPIVFDGNGWQTAVALKYGVRSRPTVFLIGRDGRLLSFNGHALYSLEFEKLVADALKAPQ